MALPTWPAQLPVLRGRVDSAGTDALYRAPKVTTFDDGPTRSRRRGLFNSDTLTIAIDLDFTTLPIFLAFVWDTLGDGSKRFAAPVVLPDGAVGTRTCRIAETSALGFVGQANPRPRFGLVVWNWRP